MFQDPQPAIRQTKSSVPKRILVMGHSDGQGGAQTAFKKLCAFTSSEGHVLKIIVLSNYSLNKQAFHRQELLGRIAYTGSRLLLPVRKILHLLFVAFKALQFKPDIFVSVGLNNSSNMMARILSKECFKVGQDFIAQRSIEDPVWASSRKVMDALVVQAPSMLKHWEDLGTDTRRVSWLPCFPESPEKGILKAKSRGSQGDIRLAYFGRLAGNKGLDMLLTGMADYRTSNNITLDLWGDGPERESLQRQASELGILSIVCFKGAYPTGAEGALLIASYDAMVLCSTGMEGLPLILLEAMAYGVPFLATNVGAIADCCTNNPDTILVNPDQESISKGLSQLLEKLRLGDFDAQRHKSYYDKRFSHQVMADRWRKFYKNPNQFFPCIIKLYLLLGLPDF
jgi:glycosyltransferase involved in cell wall biosynthesis